jgi:D-sedoheptulose 7-phosphate isomerase
MEIENFSKYKLLLNDTISRLSNSEWDLAAKKVSECFNSNTPVYIIGNGGSCHTANHFEVDWIKGIYELTGKSIKVKSLCNNNGLVTAIANDQDYVNIFLNQLMYTKETNFLLISISGSGKSKNILEAVKYANKVNAHTLSLVGYDGGDLLRLSEIAIHVPINNMQIVEDIHSTFGHFILQYFANLNNG